MKLENTEKFWRLHLRKFWPLLPELIFLGATGHWPVNPNKFEISFSFPNLLDSKLQFVKNSWGKSYTVFTILDTTYRFACGEVSLERTKLKKSYAADCLKIWQFHFRLSIMIQTPRSNPNLAKKQKYIFRNLPKTAVEIFLIPFLT